MSPLPMPKSTCQARFCLLLPASRVSGGGGGRGRAATLLVLCGACFGGAAGSLLRFLLQPAVSCSRVGGRGPHPHGVFGRFRNAAAGGAKAKAAPRFGSSASGKGVLDCLRSFVSPITASRQLCCRDFDCRGGGRERGELGCWCGQTRAATNTWSAVGLCPSVRGLLAPLPKRARSGSKPSPDDSPRPALLNSPPTHTPGKRPLEVEPASRCLLGSG